MHYRESLTVYEDLKWNIVQDLEAVWLNITVCSQSTLLGCLCHPPKSTTFLNCMYDLLGRILIKRKTSSCWVISTQIYCATSTSPTWGSPPPCKQVLRL